VVIRRFYHMLVRLTLSWAFVLLRTVVDGWTLLMVLNPTPPNRAYEHDAHQVLPKRGQLVSIYFDYLEHVFSS
jgi:hypothetical protein